MELHPDDGPGGSRRLPGLAVAGMASVGAGAVHAAAAGIHAEHPQLARLFVVMAAAQIGFGLWALLRPSRTSAWGVVLLNALAVGAWLVTRTTGISWIDGLETREAAQFADTACALMGATAVGAGLAAGLVGWRPATPGRVVMPALAVAALALPAMWSGSTHVHEHGEGGHDHATEGTDHAHDDTATDDTHDTTTDDAHTHDTTTDTTGDGHSHEPTAANWPRPWDPATDPIDFSDVEGVTQDQADRAEALVRESLADLPHWADTAVAIAEGYQSIGDAGSGSEHYINYAYVNDDKFLDARYPESLVYTVKGDERILAGAMYIAKAMPTDDPALLDFAGPLMTWHNHGDLCWDIVDG
ncbi:MAG TPA: hypothetical protein VL916_18485, partial [Ilumatobacteraceae bacterium]|nr:hypothetical protein [Ilumatobacteraceae bacterium]